jgi:hypothetical protein
MEVGVKANVVNLDHLFKPKQHADMQTAVCYNTILDRIHKRIHTTSRQHLDNVSCWFVVPEVMLGFARYDVRLCIAYLVQQLRDNGFAVSYTHPNLLFICWKHWIPDYVRDEIKKTTGVLVDGFGKEVTKAELVSAMKPAKALDPRFMPVSKYKPTGRF